MDGMDGQNQSKAKVDEPAGHGTKSRSRASTNRPEKATLPIVISAAAAVLWWMLQR